MIRAVFFDYDTTFSREMLPRPGADAFIRACANRFPLVAMTDTTRAEADGALRASGLGSLFLDIVAAAEVEHPKPAPDLMVATLGRIGFLLRDRNPVEPRECLVVESSADGVEAARSAGMHSLAIAHESSLTQLAGADFVHESFAAVDLDEILRRCAA
ncbi:MAG: HAD family hydrolase [Candidatus Binataceae bacterium]